MNAVLTRRDGEEPKMTHGNYIYYCVKWKDGGVYLFAADEYTAKGFQCSVHQMCGRITAMSDRMIEFEVYETEGKRVWECLYTYQTSCMPWIAAILYPHRNVGPCGSERVKFAQEAVCLAEKQMNESKQVYLDCCLSNIRAIPIKNPEVDEKIEHLQTIYATAVGAWVMAKKKLQDLTRV